MIFWNTKILICIVYTLQISFLTLWYLKCLRQRLCKNSNYAYYKNMLLQPNAWLKSFHPFVTYCIWILKNNYLSISFKFFFVILHIPDHDQISLKYVIIFFCSIFEVIIYVSDIYVFHNLKLQIRNFWSEEGIY